MMTAETAHRRAMRFPARSTEQGLSDFIQNARREFEQIRGPWFDRLPAEAAEHVREALADLASLAFDATTNPVEGPKIAVEVRYTYAQLTARLAAQGAYAEQDLRLAIRRTLFRGLAMFLA